MINIFLKIYFFSIFFVNKKMKLNNKHMLILVLIVAILLYSNDLCKGKYYYPNGVKTLRPLYKQIDPFC